MNFLFPILAAVLQAGSYTVDKVVLSLRRVCYRTYVGFSFPLIFAITLLIFLIFRPPLSASLLAGRLCWFLLLVVGLRIAGNLLFYRALDANKLGEIQTVDLLRNIPLIILSSIVFTDERNWALIIPALVASLAIIWSHWEGKTFKISRYAIPFLVWTLVATPLREISAKILLQSWHPISLELVCAGAMALFLFPLIPAAGRKIGRKAFFLLILTNILTASAWILYYFSYQRLGIVQTVLLFSLQPLLVYLASLFLLKEAPQRKKIIAFIIVLVSLVVAQIIK